MIAHEQFKLPSVSTSSLFNINFSYYYLLSRKIFYHNFYLRVALLEVRSKIYNTNQSSLYQVKCSIFNFYNSNLAINSFLKQTDFDGLIESPNDPQTLIITQWWTSTAHVHYQKTLLCSRFLSPPCFIASLQINFQRYILQEWKVTTRLEHSDCKLSHQNLSTSKLFRINNTRTTWKREPERPNHSRFCLLYLCELDSTIINSRLWCDWLSVNDHILQEFVTLMKFSML